MKKIFENVGWKLLEIFIVLLVIFGILVWFGMIFVGGIDLYKMNPNTLFVYIPFIIIVHIWIYLNIKYTRI